MKTLARVTGLIILIFGVAAVALGIYWMVRGVTQPEPLLPSFFGGADRENLLLPLRMLVGGAIMLQGLMTAAVGEGLWLLAGLVDNSQRANEKLAAMDPRGSLHLP